MSRVAGVVGITSGIVYLLLGCAALVEAVLAGRLGASRRFGFALAALALTGGGQGLLGSVDISGGQRHDAVPLLAATSLGLLPAAVFGWLRCEAWLGGAGDRIIHGSPSWVPLLPGVFAFVAGALVVVAWSNHVPLTVLALPGAVVAGIMLIVGWHLLRAQQIRHSMAGGWSLSGVAVAFIFPTWAGIFVSRLLAGEDDGAIGVVSLLAVPAAAWFLVECRRLVSQAKRSGSRATLAVSPQRARRPAPWAKTGAF